MFFWAFKAKNPKKGARIPLVLWMTGGPGCSSELAMFAENGPWRVNLKGELEANPNSWNNEAHLLYIDQPLGTGFSTVDPEHPVKDEETVSSMAYEFLSKFIQKDFAREWGLPGSDFFVFGESYAGHYVPWVANRVWSENNKHLPLKGAAIGNGLPNPHIQYSAYADFSLFNSLIDWNSYMHMKAEFRHCEALMEVDSTQARGRADCDAMVGQILTGAAGKFDMAGTNQSTQRFNTYDITRPCNGPLCYNFTPINRFLNRPDVIASLGLKAGTVWQECNGEAGAQMAEFDWTKDASQKLGPLIDAGIKVLMYHGDLDFICNWVGGQRALNLVNHSYTDGWSKAT